ncbi:MAG: hypothetical protein R2881_10170 [Eubacteriales bacterium]
MHDDVMDRITTVCVPAFRRGLCRRSAGQWKITARASYIFVFSAQALIVYFAGLIGILPYVAYTMFGGGIVALVALILNKKIAQAYNRSRLSARSILRLSRYSARSAHR